jgi:hypothetical protein
MADWHRVAAMHSDAGSRDAVANLRSAADWYQRSLESWQQVRQSGNLRPIDAAKPDEVAQALGECKAALGSDQARAPGA